MIEETQIFGSIQNTINEIQQLGQTSRKMNENWLFFTSSKNADEKDAIEY